MPPVTPKDSDYSQMRGIANEPHWNKFVVASGGELVSPLIKRQGVQNADYLFQASKVIAELKVFETEFAHSKEMKAKLDKLFEKYPGIDPDDPDEPLRGEILQELKKPLQRIVNKANRQIKETKAELGLPDHRGILICVNDAFKGVPPPLVISLIANIMSGTSYKSITAVIYLTNHYVELDEIPYASLLWSPMYAESAGDDLVDFVNDLGRKWRAYAESIEGPYDFSEEREHLDLSAASIVSGPYRNKRYEGDL